MPQRTILTALMTSPALLVSPLLHAHPGVHGMHGFADGFMHPVTDPLHLLVAIAAGFWVARTGRHSLLGIGLFLATMLGGILLGIAARLFPAVETGTLLLFALPAIVIATAIGAHRFLGYAFFGCCALYLGVAHILALPAVDGVTGYAMGLLLSTGVMLAPGVMLRQVINTHRADRHTVPHG